MLKKILLILFIIVFTKFTCFAYQPFLPEGSIIKVYAKVPLSTEQLEEGSKVYFIAPADVWVLEKKAIEKGDIFCGYISMLKMPIQGVNAAMQIKITDIIKKDGEKRQLIGRLILNSSDTIGGTLTPPASYNKTIHPRKVYGNNWGGTLQYVPSGEYEFGHHVMINSRDSIFVRLDENYYI